MSNGRKMSYASKVAQLQNDCADFSLVLGGPFYQLMKRVRLVDSTLMLLRRRIVVLTIFAWLPLLLLTSWENNLLVDSVKVPFLMDFEVHIRFLIALPLLIIAEPVVHQRMRNMILQFTDRQLIPEDKLESFHNSVTSAFRLRNSLTAECLLIIFVYCIGVMVIWRQYLAIDTVTWYATPMAEGSVLSWAGVWYAFVSLPLVQFLLCRWYFRIFIWVRLLWQIARIKLALIPTHPDRVGGLGFLVTAVNALIVLAIAHGALVTGQIVNHIILLGHSLPDFTIEIATMVIFMHLLILAPLLLFSPQLMEIKWTGVYEYGGLYARLIRGIDHQWLREGKSTETSFDKNLDIHSLTTLDGGYKIVQSMRIAPFTWETILLLTMATLIPVAPLALTMMPIDELLNILLSTLF